MFPVTLFFNSVEVFLISVAKVQFFLINKHACPTFFSHFFYIFYICATWRSGASGAKWPVVHLKDVFR